MYRDDYVDNLNYNDKKMALEYVACRKLPLTMDLLMKHNASMSYIHQLFSVVVLHECQCEPVT